MRSIQLDFIPCFGKDKLELEKLYYSASTKDSIRIDVLKFYVSDITLLQNEKICFQENNFHLIDAEQKRKVEFQIPQYTLFTGIRFKIGVDSLTNVSGAMGGDLDPTKGMYWAWQSGYINFKLEGFSKKCLTRNNQFQFHIGGYLPPYACLQEVYLSPLDKSIVEVYFDVEKFISQLDLSKENEIMSPGENALRISKIYPPLFSLEK